MPFALLEGLKVLDLGVLAAGPYCTKLLADAGADVIHVEQPESGDPSRAFGSFAPWDTEHQLGALFAFLNAGKRSAALDWTQPDGAALLWRLIDWADVLVENFPPGTPAQHGFGTEALLARKPSLVQVSISPYGQTGPYRDFAATELTLQAMAGMLDGNGLSDREPIRYPGFVAQYMAGVNAAYTALVAYRHAQRTGRGQQVDVSIQESVAATYFSLWANYEYLGSLQQRGQKDLYPTADGMFLTGWRTSVPWEVFALAFDAVELTLDPVLKPPLGMSANRPRIDEILTRHFLTRPRRHWFGQALEHRIAAGMLQTLEEVQACPQLAARGSFDELATPSGATVHFPGAPYWVDGRRPGEVRRVPALGEHNREILDQLPAQAPAAVLLPATPAGPALAGIRIVDNGIVEAGTFPARCLADFGAEVVRVENFPAPDLARNGAIPDGLAGEQYWEQGGTYHEQHRNKDLCIGLDLRRPEGHDAFLRLCMTSDVVLDSHPPDVMEKLGLGPAALRRIKPDLVVITTSGYGYGGPYTLMRSYGMYTELMCGLSSLNGHPGGEPRRGTIPITDNMSVFHIAFVIMAALAHRDRTGEGVWIDVSQYEIGINVLGDIHVAHAIGAPVPAQQGNVDLPQPVSGCYACLGDDEWVTLSVQDRAAWQALYELIGRPELASPRDPWRDALSPAERGELDEAIHAWTSVRTPAACLAELQAQGIAAGAVEDVRDLLLDPHLQERGFFWLVDHHPIQGAGRRAWPGASARLTQTPGRLRRHAPLLGEHNAEVLGDLLGIGPERYEAMLTSGAAGTLPLAAGVRPQRVTALPVKDQDPAYQERLSKRFGAGFGAGHELVR